MNKLEAIKYFISKIEFDSNEAFACIREIVEDFVEPIGIEIIYELIDFCNEGYEDDISF